MRVVEMKSRRRLLLGGVRVAALSFTAGALPASFSPARAAGIHQAEVEARVSWAPQAVRGSDGRTHLAYELHVTSFHGGSTPLRLMQVTVLAVNPVPDLAMPLLDVAGEAVGTLLSPAPAVAADGVAIETGRRRILFLWVDVPKGVDVTALRHRLRFMTGEGEVQVADGVRVEVRWRPPVALGPPLRGRWLANEGPGDRLSHHWGSPTAINGRVTIPQRFAIDWFGLDAADRSVRGPANAVASSTDADWVGFGADVLAVADGVVRDARDGVADGQPLAPLADPGDLTARSLYGNFVVLELAPGVFAHYVHLRRGSLRVRVGQRVRRGAVIGAVGQTGSAGAPHLHFHVADAATFEESEGLPFTIDAFRVDGNLKVEETFGDDAPPASRPALPAVHRRELPLSGDIVVFGER